MKSVTVRDPKFWTCNEHAERLTHVDFEEAVQEWADDSFPEPLPETVVVHGFAPMEATGRDIEEERVLEYLLESMDEEYGDPEGDYTRPTESMKAAAKVFVQAIYSEYESWACEKVCEKTVTVSDIITAEIPIREPEELRAEVEK